MKGLEQEIEKTRELFKKINQRLDEITLQEEKLKASREECLHEIEKLEIYLKGLTFNKLNFKESPKIKFSGPHGGSKIDKIFTAMKTLQKPLTLEEIFQILDIRDAESKKKFTAVMDNYHYTQRYFTKVGKNKYFLIPQGEN